MAPLPSEGQGSLPEPGSYRNLDKIKAFPKKSLLFTLDSAIMRGSLEVAKIGPGQGLDEKVKFCEMNEIEA